MRNITKLQFAGWLQIMGKPDNLFRCHDLADRKGYDVTQSTMRDHLRLIDKDGNLIKNKNGGAAFRLRRGHKSKAPSERGCSLL